MKERSKMAKAATETATEETKRLVPKSHTNRPYFDKAPITARRSGTPMYSSDKELNYSRAGIGVVFRDADSSARALQELSQKKQERVERTRAGILLGLLIFTAAAVHMVTRPAQTPSLNQSRDKTYNTGGKEVDYGSSDGEKDVDGSMMQLRTGQNETRKQSILDHFSDSMEEFGDTMTPYFFHVPRSGGESMKEIVGVCLKKVQANSVGIREGHGADPTLQIVTIEEARYVNVDTTSKEGIERAAMMGFSAMHMADLVTSPYFLNVAKFLFSTERQGRAFVILRHPVHRAVSMYYFKKSLGQIDESITLQDYAQGNGIENNWMTRFLTNALEGELKKSHLDQAKKILSKKFLVGFLDDPEESMERAMKFFGWKYDEDETKALMQQDCVKRKLQEGVNRNDVPYELPSKGSQAHALLSWQTQFDLKLYEFAKQLFDIQTKQYGSKERKKELKKKQKNTGK
jgi:hypothetical protein